MTQITLPMPLGMQPEVLRSPARFKVLRVGRRGSKTVCADIMCVAGHGPIENSVPKWRGVAQGLDVIWLAPDNTQNEMLWRNTVEKRYRGIHPAVKVDASKRFVSFNALGGGTLWYRSMENIRATRGAGAGLGGVVVEEAAWIDLETALRDVIIPALTDEDGWLTLISTTNAGPDGNALKRTPSYFNLICEEIIAGKRSEEWQQWHWTARENPAISAKKFADLVAEYPDKTDPKYQQEVEAALLRAGVGLAFPEWDKRVHVLPAFVQIPPHWRWVAGMDWGFGKPGHFGLYACGSDGEVWLIWEYKFLGIGSEDVGYNIGMQAPQYGQLPEWVACDEDMWNVTDGGKTIGEKVQAGLNKALGGHVVPCIGAPKGPGSRKTGKVLVHDVLKWGKDADGNPVPWAPPKLRVHPRCEYFLKTVPTLPLDPKDPEDVDTKTEDHAYDALRYMLIARTPESQQPRQSIPDDVHPGFMANGQRRSRERTPEAEAEELQVLLAQQGVHTGGRYGRKR